MLLCSPRGMPGECGCVWPWQPPACLRVDTLTGEATASGSVQAFIVLQAASAALCWPLLAPTRACCKPFGRVCLLRPAAGIHMSVPALTYLLPLAPCCQSLHITEQRQHDNLIPTVPFRSVPLVSSKRVHHAPNCVVHARSARPIDMCMAWRLHTMCPRPCMRSSPSATVAVRQAACALAGPRFSSKLKL